MRIVGFERGLRSQGRLNAAAGDECIRLGFVFRTCHELCIVFQTQSRMIDRTPALPTSSCHFRYTHRLLMFLMMSTIVFVMMIDLLLPDRTLNLPRFAKAVSIPISSSCTGAFVSC